MANIDFKNAGEINSKGGSLMSYKEVDSDGNDLTVPDTWHSFPYRSKSDIEFKEPQKAVYDESGAVVAYETDNFDATLTVTSLQDSAAIENFLLNVVPGKFFAIFQDCGIDSPGKRKERFIPVTEIERSYKGSAPGRTPDIKIGIRQASIEVTPATVPEWAYGVVGDFKVSAGGYYAVKASSKV